MYHSSCSEIKELFQQLSIDTNQVKERPIDASAKVFYSLLCGFNKNDSLKLLMPHRSLLIHVLQLYFASFHSIYKQQLTTFYSTTRSRSVVSLSKNFSHLEFLEDQHRSLWFLMEDHGAFTSEFVDKLKSIPEYDFVWTYVVIFGGPQWCPDDKMNVVDWKLVCCGPYRLVEHGIINKYNIQEYVNEYNINLWIESYPEIFENHSELIVRYATFDTIPLLYQKGLIVHNNKLHKQLERKFKGNIFYHFGKNKVIFQPGRKKT